MTADITIGIAGIALGFITSYIFYRIQKRRRELCWSSDSISLIKGYSSLFEQLDVQYGGQRIENLTVSKIVIWNNGNETIDRKDVAIPLFIAPKDETTKILDAKIIKASTIGNRFEILQEQGDRSLIILSFDYLDPEQGAVIQVVHTGVLPSPLMVDGEIKGVKGIEFKSKTPDFDSRIYRLFMYFLGLLSVMSLGIYAHSFISMGISTRTDWSVWLWAILASLTVLFIVRDIRQMKNTAKIPKELSVFFKKYDISRK